MADPGEIVETPQTPIDDGSGQEYGPDLTRRSSAKRKGSRKRRNSRPQSPTQNSQLVQGPEEGRNENGSGGQFIPRLDGQRQGTLSTQGDHEARFYDSYREVAEEYDREFLKKYGEDLDTALIFAGLFSAVTSAFIIQVDSQLQPDPGDETAALLRVLIYKIDNTTFGNDVPTPPQWNGPTTAMVHVQTLLFASLAASLFTALLAMLGKQWLNRYDSSDIRGSAIERGRNRQRKLRGMDTWYFSHVMESLPLMLQVALLLLGCALSRYLWEVSILVASVVLSVTSFGVLFYIFIVIAGATSEDCPYQTPASLALRYLRQNITGIIRRLWQKVITWVLGNLLRESSFTTLFINLSLHLSHPARFIFWLYFTLLSPLIIPLDLMQGILRELATSLIFLLSHGTDATPTPEQRSDQQEIALTCVAFRGPSRRLWTKTSVCWPLNTLQRKPSTPISTPPSLQIPASMCLLVA